MVSEMVAEKWQAQLSDMICDPARLKEVACLGAAQCDEISRISVKYKMGISPYYAGLFSTDDPDCPIKKQCIPSVAELDNSEIMQTDPLNESAFSKTPYLVHKYADKAIFFASSRCFTYCRHCSRKNTVINDGASLSAEEFSKALDYIKKTPQLRDILITGGDPLTLPDSTLEYYISEIRKIAHIQTIRIGTRAIVTCPMRITEKVADMLEKYHPIWLNTQFNHPNEITEQATKACERLINRGIPLGNQTVLLKGVNDSIDIIEQLVLGLIRIRVRPYYLYQCDFVRGVEHFITQYAVGADIISMLAKRVSGYAVPRFVIDAPGENGGKIVAERSNIISECDDYLILNSLNGAYVKYRKK